MKITHNHPNCEKCQLSTQCQTPWMESEGVDEPLVLVIGEAPGEAEDLLGSPFVGRSGKLLRETLADAGLDISKDVRFTNIVRCRPPDNKITKKAIDCCKHFALDEIEYYDPDLVLLMGNTPLQAVLGESGITTWNGVTVERDGRAYVPLFHPAYILRNPDAGSEWLDGLDRAMDILANGAQEHNWQYFYPETLAEVRAMVDWLLEQPIVAYDTETSSLDPFHENITIPCVSFAAEGRAYAVKIHMLERSAQVISAITPIFHQVNLIGHNIKFDKLHTRRSLGIDFRAYGDTMLVSHMLDSRQGIHSLKRLAGLHLGMYDYDKELKDYVLANPACNPDKGGSYANVPPEVLLPYAAKDAQATYMLWHKLFPLLSDKQQGFYLETIMGASNTLAAIEYNGAAIDDYVANRYVQLYGHIQRGVLSGLLSDDKVVKTVDKLQKMQDHKLANGAASYKVEGDYIHIDGRKRKRKMVEFNPNSTHHLRELYFKQYKIPVLGRTESGEPSTSAAAMKSQVTEFPIVGAVTYYRLLTKMLGTYLEPAANGKWKSGDGRVRSNYNLHGTRTGRLSSSNPNLQNIPTPEKEADANPYSALVWMPIKNLFTHSWGPGKGVLMSVDYSGMELRVFASLAKCYPMIEIHKSGADFHSMVAIMAQTGSKPGDISKEAANRYKKDYPAVRYRYKWTNWTLLYGGDEYTLMNLYGMEEADAKHTVATYYQTFPEVLEFRRWTQAFAERNGYIESPFGRREGLAYINDNSQPAMRNSDRRSAVNMPVQSAASDTLLCALIIIHAKIQAAGLRSMLVNTVHDSIVLDVPMEEIDEVAGICVDVMENIVLYSKDYLPSVDFDWLICPLKADVEVGTHYGQEMSLKDWKNGLQVM